MRSVVVTLVLLLLVSTAITVVSRIMVGRAQTTLRDQVIPMMRAVDDLALAYADQETGERGFLLSDDPIFLQPYRSGTRGAARAVATLNTLMAGDAQGRALVGDVTASASAWRRAVGEPTVKGGPTKAERSHAALVKGRQLFNDLRLRVAALRAYVSSAVNHQIDRIQQARRVANLITGILAGVAVGVALLGLVTLRRRLTAPLNDLVVSVDRVAAGDYESPVPSSGPTELRRIGGAVESMRRSILDASAASAESQRDLALVEERERMASDLHDSTIQRVFALSLALSAELARHPDRAGVLTQMIADTDDIIRELGSMIFDIREPQVDDTSAPSD